jgi:hypothetical protein
VPQPPQAAEGRLPRQRSVPRLVRARAPAARSISRRRSGRWNEWASFLRAACTVGCPVSDCHEPHSRSLRSGQRSFALRCQATRFGVNPIRITPRGRRRSHRLPHATRHVHANRRVIFVRIPRPDRSGVRRRMRATAAMRRIRDLGARAAGMVSVVEARPHRRCARQERKGALDRRASDSSKPRRPLYRARRSKRLAYPTQNPLTLNRARQSRAARRHGPCSARPSSTRAARALALASARHQAARCLPGQGARGRACRRATGERSSCARAFAKLSRVG